MSESDNLYEEVIEWGCNYLLSHRYELNNNLPEKVQHTPWSYVVRFVTTEGYIYLKHTPPLIALEAIITQCLHDQFQAPVPEVIAHNAQLNCFLMKDAGKLLRKVLKSQFDAALVCKAIDQFTLMQLAVTDYVDTFIDMGVPDWRLNKLPHLFEQLLSEKELLIADGLTEVEIHQLKLLLPKISSLCKVLSSYAIKQTIIQPDFHDNNLLIDEMKNITIIDLGEIVISHPFFSLIACLQQIKKHHSLLDADTAYLQILEAALKNYMKMESKERVLDAMAIARILLWVYGALANERLMKACGEEKLMSFQYGRLSCELKELLNACMTANE